MAQKKQMLIKQSPKHGGNNGHQELLCKILCIVENTEHKVNHLVREGDHIENLIKGIGAGGTPEQIQEILNKIAESKTKLAQALEATPPASTESGS
jgi:hypothetical protein